MAERPTQTNGICVHCDQAIGWSWPGAWVHINSGRQDCPPITKALPSWATKKENNDD